MSSALVIACGSRTWTDRQVIADAFARWQDTAAADEVTLIHGGAAGADRLAAIVAQDRGWQVECLQPDWTHHGRRAGVLRNLAMLDCGPARVFVFWDGSSRGTAHVIGEVRSRRLSHEIAVCDHEIEIERAQ